MNPVIYIGTTPIDVDSNISIVLRSPVFNESGTAGSFVFNFSVPLTGDVKQELGFAHRSGAHDRVFYHPVKIYAGSFHLAGTAKITASSPDTIEISLPVFNSCLKKELEEIKLTDISLPNFQTGELSKVKAHLDQQVTFYREHSFNEENLLNTHVDFHSTSIDPLNSFNTPGDTFVVPHDGLFTFFFNISYRVSMGDNLRIQLIKTNPFEIFSERLVYKAELHNYVDQKMISFTELLNEGDEISLRIMCDGLYMALPDGGMGYMVWLHLKDSTYLKILSSYSDLGGGHYPDSTYALFPIYNNNFHANTQNSEYEVDNAGYDFLNKIYPFVNFYYNNAFPVALSGEEDNETFEMYNILAPCIYLSYVILKIFEKADIAVDNFVFSNYETRQLCIYANKSINTVDTGDLNAIIEDYPLNNLLPDIDAFDFILDICKTLGIVFHYDHNRKRIHFVTLDEIMTDTSAVDLSKNILSKPSIDFEHYDSYLLKYEDIDDTFIQEYFNDIDDVNYLGEVGSLNNLPGDANYNDCYYVSEEKAYYVLKHDPTEDALTWGLYSLSFQFKISSTLLNHDEKKTFEYSLPSNPIMMRTSPKEDPSFGIDGRDILVPGTYRPGYLVGMKKPDPAYYLVFYRGMANDGNNNEYPFGSSGYKELDGSDATRDKFDFNLNADDAYSIYNQRFKKYLHWRVLAQGTYTFHKIMTTEDLVNFDFFSWYRILDMDFLVKELKFEITKNGLSPVEISAVPRTQLSDEKSEE